MPKKYQMSEDQKKKAFEHFKTDPTFIKAMELGWIIYIREDGFLTLNPNKYLDKLSKNKLAKIEKNYCLL